MDEIYQNMSDDLESVPESAMARSKIQDYFAGKSLLVTGVTGFMGKCFVEKILKDCPGIKTLYVLVRQGKAKSVEERMRTYFSNFLFDNVRSQDPNFVDKVVAIRGDLQEDRLGISPEDRQLLIDNVDIIVHNGATVKFDEIVSVALTINVLATKHMLDLASECKHLLSFAYVSTAYSHCYQKNIEEKFYDPPGDLKVVYDMIASDKAAVNGLSNDAVKMLLGKWPNIYTFSKSIAEDLVRQYGNKFPCFVYRPSIVTASYHTPVPGWIGNNNGPAYIFLGFALGFIHTSYLERGQLLDLIPADFTINALISAIYDCPKRWELEKKSVVYNYGSSTIAPLLLVDLYKSFLEEAPLVGSKWIVWYPFMIFVDKIWLFFILHFFLHFIPAIFGDLALVCMGKRPRALKLCWMATMNVDKIVYFGSGGWKIHMPESMKMLDRLNPYDRQLFPYDMRNFNWFEFTSRYVRGARIYVINEPLDNVPQTKIRYQRMKLLHYITTGLLFLLITYWATKLLICFVNLFI